MYTTRRRHALKLRCTPGKREETIGRTSCVFQLRCPKTFVAQCGQMRCDSTLLRLVGLVSYGSGRVWTMIGLEKQRCRNQARVCTTVVVL